jgi:hypothetical protein
VREIFRERGKPTAQLFSIKMVCYPGKIHLFPSKILFAPLQIHSNPGKAHSFPAKSLSDVPKLHFYEGKIHNFPPRIHIDVPETHFNSGKMYYFPLQIHSDVPKILLSCIKYAAIASQLTYVPTKPRKR